MRLSYVYEADQFFIMQKRFSFSSALSSPTTTHHRPPENRRPVFILNKKNSFDGYGEVRRWGREGRRETLAEGNFLNSLAHIPRLLIFILDFFFGIPIKFHKCLGRKTREIENYISCRSTSEAQSRKEENPKSVLRQKNAKYFAPTSLGCLLIVWLN